ncbi:hypothetical protein [Seonamhaeicola marinus]|uniref:DNA topoisomerase IV n=1 Tax=Seonamhaeicola marinus TaxID=1912246 RepID=A0A5D0HV67_9FLAO|nr:hypothetical protein [Seonamhaeicola marinus]TYA74369.1 hypothetical protein FUA24_13675 [Seonamhaeicola marinus]
MEKIILFLFALICFKSYSQNCKEVRTGKFIIENKDYGGSIIIRTENSQEEIVEQLNIHSKFDVTWIDDCNYALSNKVKIKGSEYAFLKGKKTDTIFIQIMKTTANSYTFKATSNFSEFETVGIAKKKL